MNMSFSEVNDSPREWDEVPEVQPEEIAERESMESYSLYGFKYLISRAKLREFSRWWAKRGRMMSRPLDLNITY